MYRPLTTLDDFAGTGWGVACHDLGIEEHGVELMPEAVATREANGMTTVGRDVWEHIASGADRHADIYIASPPCQTFSMAGGGAGRRALDTVLGLIDERAYERVADLHAFGLEHDPRTALVLAPLVRIARDLPLFIVLEQVPPVLPVWQRYATELEKWGYSTWTGVLNAEQYGVPQTRKRAILIARADGIVAAPPTPTHSRYYPRDPSRLDTDVLPWVSMAKALGWGRTARSSVTVTGGGTETGGAEPLGHWSRETSAPDFAGRVINLDPAKPATTVAADPRLTAREHHNHGEQSSTSTRVTIEEAAALQSYPPGFTFAGTKTKQFLQVGNAVPPLLARAVLSVFLPEEGALTS